LTPPRLVDLSQVDDGRVIACYLVDTDEGPALFDCGPTTSIGALKRGLAGYGVELRDIRNLVLSHIHLDHAGAAGALVREHPRLQVWVAEAGAPHLVDPSRLERSARRLFGGDYDRLWGEVAPVPEENIRLAGDRVLGLECFPSPGHAEHHVTCVDGDGTMYGGDAAGVRVVPARYAFAPTPPPEVDVEAWHRSLDEMEERRPQRLALGHFGVVDEPASHLAEVRARLMTWAERVRAGMSEEEFTATVRAEIAAAEGRAMEERYAAAAPAWQSWQGLRRYCEKREGEPGPAPRRRG
jgi:glyoxylase-like metal-dependent hydrolase (beta-lactamase superfamily II)